MVREPVCRQLVSGVIFPYLREPNGKCITFANIRRSLDH